MNTNLTLELWNHEDNAQIGSDSSALSIDTWYRIELKVDCTTISSTSIEARIDGVAFASGTINLAAGVDQADFFGIHQVAGFSHTGAYFWDDMAVNDDSGSFQNSWPGEGEIIHLRPNADGDNSGWTVILGGSQSGALDEVTPDDATTYVQTTVDGTITDVNIDATPAALASDDTINCVQVGIRMQNSSNTGDEIVLRIKASASGTTEESGNIEGNTSWNTNATAAPRNYQLTLYDLPGASTTAWTKSDLDSAQIGIKANQAGDVRNVSTLWLLVDHKPAAAAATTQTAVFMTTNTSFFGA